MGDGEKQRSIADLEKEIAKRDRWIDQRDHRIDSLEREIERLRRENEKLQQAARRQAAPFSRGEPKPNPKRRGRKSGKRYGRRVSRSVPRTIDRVIEVPAPLFFPDCQKTAKLDHRETQWQTDIPPVVPVTTEFRIDVARCTNCGRTVRNRHPEQISDATGAAGVQLGPRVIALSATLNKECGVSYERIERLLGAVFALRVNRSSINRAVLRLAADLNRTLIVKEGEGLRKSADWTTREQSNTAPGILRPCPELRSELLGESNLAAAERLPTTVAEPQAIGERLATRTAEHRAPHFMG